MKKNSELSESLEDYLEVILDLEKTNKVGPGQGYCRAARYSTRFGDRRFESIRGKRADQLCAIQLYYLNPKRKPDRPDDYPASMRV